MKTLTKKIVQHGCEDCIYLKFEEYTPKKGFPFVKAFFHCTKTDLYVRGFLIYQNKEGTNEEQLKKLFQYCPLKPHEREFLEFHMELDNEGD